MMPTHAFTPEAPAPCAGILTLAFLALVSVLGVLTPTLLTGRIRDAMRAAERSLMVQKWQRSQLSAATSKSAR